MTASRFDTLVDRAEELGASCGRDDAGWYFDGNTSAETYARVLQGLEDGDPAIVDTFPANPLSGEWAYGITSAAVLQWAAKCDDAAVAILSDELRHVIYTAFEMAYDVAVAEGIERVARLHAGGMRAE